MQIYGFVLYKHLWDLDIQFYLKVNIYYTTLFTHCSVFACLGEYNCICEKKKKLFIPVVAPEECIFSACYWMHASIPVIQWLSCIVGNGGCRSQKPGLIMDSLWTVRKQTIKTSDRLPFFNLAPTLPTVQRAQLSDIAGENLSDYMQLPLEPQIALFCFAL